jgi:patatin-like phospholipase/acyl hydrolase
MEKQFKILSIDGGGLRGLIPLLVLKEVEKITGKKIHELFDLIVGTSTGGIIACGLTATKDGKTPLLTIDELIELYTTKGGVIFPYKNNLFTKISSLFDPKFKADGLDKTLNEYFLDLKLNNTLKPIIVSSYDIRNNEVVMFKSRKSNESGYNVLLKDVCRATSAAPTYLPSYEISFAGKLRTCIDGGVFINNPALAAVSDAIRNTYGIKDLNMSDITLLSLGTGIYTENLGVKNTDDWGLKDWARPISDIMMQATSKSVDYECNELLDKYLRFQITIDDKAKSDMSDSRPETANYLIDRVKTQILNDSKKLKELKNFLKDNKF